MNGAQTMENSALRPSVSAGTNLPIVYELAARILHSAGRGGDRLLDVGCGTAALWSQVADHFAGYVGVDLIRQPGFPKDAEFVEVDLNAQPLPFSDDYADAVISLGVVEYLENPRAFMRELVRVAKPRATILVSTSNHLNMLSKATFLLRHQFNAMQDTNPSHPISAVLESDLRRMAIECGLLDIAIHYPGGGRIPLTMRHWPRAIGLCRRCLSDVVLMSARRS